MREGKRDEGRIKKFLARFRMPTKIAVSSSQFSHVIAIAAL